MNQAALKLWNSLAGVTLLDAMLNGKPFDPTKHEKILADLKAAEPTNFQSTAPTSPVDGPTPPATPAATPSISAPR